jgi:WD40 repeat protein
LDAQGRFLATGPASTMAPRSLFLFDLDAPATAEPVALAGFDGTAVNSMQFSPDGSWLGIGLWGSAALWNLSGPKGYVIGRIEPPAPSLAFTQDGALLSTSVNGEELARWPLSSAPGETARTLWSGPCGGTAILAVDPGGEFAVVACNSRGEIVFVPLDASAATIHRFHSPEGEAVGVAPGSLDPTARLLALSAWAGGGLGGHEWNAIRIVDRETGDERVLDSHPSGDEGCEEAGSKFAGFAVPVWLPDGRLVSDGDAGLRLWDLAAGTSRQLRPCRKSNLASLFLLATPDSRMIVRLDIVFGIGDTSWLSTFELASGETREIASHGKLLSCFALDPAGTTLVTGDIHGVVRVGPLSGDEPHLLHGHSVEVSSVAVSPDGRWIASGSDDGTLRLWPMPDLSKPPLHTLPHDELIAKLRSLTNLRAVRDPDSDTGWKIEVGTFPGWAEVPEW